MNMTEILEFEIAEKAKRAEHEKKMAKQKEREKRLNSVAADIALVVTKDNSRFFI